MNKEIEFCLYSVREGSFEERRSQGGTFGDPIMTRGMI